MNGPAVAVTVQRAPHPALRGLVTTYHGYHYGGLPAGEHHGLPSTELTAVIAFDEPLDVGWLADDTSRDRHWALVSGLHDGPALIRHAGRQHGVQLGLTPLGARVLLGLPAGELARTLVPMRLLADGTERLYDDAAGAPTWERRFAALDRHLLALAGRAEVRPIREELRWAWRRLHATAGRVAVAELAREVGWSRRHLAATFAREFGVGPKQAARVLRFERSRSLLLDGHRAADVAAACGFADQAHLSREWQRLAGYSPRQWMRAEVPFLQDRVAPD